MVSQSWDGKRVYFTSSLLAKWDGTSGDDAQFLKVYGWDGTRLEPAFEIDFRENELGRPHIMRFGQIDYYHPRTARAESGGRE